MPSCAGTSGEMAQSLSTPSQGSIGGPPPRSSGARPATCRRTPTPWGPAGGSTGLVRLLPALLWGWSPHPLTVPQAPLHSQVPLPFLRTSASPVCLPATPPHMGRITALPPTLPPGHQASSIPRPSPAGGVSLGVCDPALHSDPRSLLGAVRSLPAVSPSLCSSPEPGPKPSRLWLLCPSVLGVCATLHLPLLSKRPSNTLGSEP